MMQKDLFIIKELYNIIENTKCETFSDAEIVKGLRKIINEKWITIHPHGNIEDENGKKDYRRLKLEDGETPKEAIERVYGKDDKPKEEPKNQPKEEKKSEETTKSETPEELAKKIQELREKGKRIGGEKTVLGRKYLQQAEELEKQQKENELKELNNIQGDKAITDKLAQMSEEITDLEMKRWNFGLSNEEREEAKDKLNKLNEQASELAKRLSFMGDNWKNASGDTVSVTGFKDGRYVVTTDRSSKWGISKEYTYFTDASQIQKLKEADTKGYDKAQKKRQEKEARISKKVEYKKGGIPKAKSKEEAEKIAEEYNIADTINYGNLSVEICNALNESANDIYAEFPKVRELNKEFGSLQAKNKNLIDEAFEVQGEALSVPIRARIEKLRKIYGDDYIKRHYGSNETLEKTIAEEVKKKLKARIGISRASGEVAHCRYSPPSQLGIVWNEKYKNMKNMNIHCESGYHPKDSGSLKAVADHEFGHLIDRFIQLKGVSKSKSYDELRRYYGTLSKKDIADGLSRYANEKFAEFIAEGFSEYKNSPSPRPIAQKVGKLLTQAYKEVEDYV